ncbi:histidine phosphatase family protein [Aspergillus fijiensis CBS 313.89]|uniref:Putative phytase n=1 Tax=Aspergillus fijiensis CBS 313.89 TaxID=1448319 RepID=A0A8G1RYF4_9EURO|nr:putative phytase [Aspergillus fijiensis CBS 313.89]RAK81179.1 putative phytase [Aspergillus fijiensis CBS 313.89]
MQTVTSQAIALAAILVTPGVAHSIPDWGALTPYHEVSSFGASGGIPQGCRLSQAHVLHRHTERYPTSYFLEGGQAEVLADKIATYQSAHPDTTFATGPLAFLNEWQYIFAGGGTNTLLPSGTTTAHAAGAAFWSQYGRLLYDVGTEDPFWREGLNVSAKLVFRTTSEERIVESAKWWLNGFFANADATSAEDQYSLVILPEGPGLNNTLAPYDVCEGDMTEGETSLTHDFIPRFTSSALERFSAYLPESFNLTALDIYAMMTLCPFETSALGAPSPFCALFTDQEWKDYDYASDLHFYGDYGFGSPSGRAQGIGYVVELATRIAGEHLHKGDVGINYTYDNNEATFPTQQAVYMDMAHDDTIISVLTALGLAQFKEGPAGLSGKVDHAPEHRFRTKDITPFGARLVAEIWSCSSNNSNTADFTALQPVLYRNPGVEEVAGGTDYIRFVLNGGPVALEGLSGCEDAVNGFCPLEGFLGGIAELKEQAQYDYACGAGYTAEGQVADGVPV